MDGVVALALSKGYTDEKVGNLGNVLNYKGVVATVEDLPASGNKVGDVYTVTATGAEYVWVNKPNAHWESIGASLGSNVSVSSTGTSTNDVRYITINGTESRFSAVALKAMKSAWVTGNTLDAANAILNDDSVVAGDGFLATVYWDDLPAELSQAEVKAFVMKKSGSYQKIVQFECTSGTMAPYSWFYNSYEKVWRSQVPINDTLTSTSESEALSAKQGKVLADMIQNLTERVAALEG